jgi:hypothetical protein
MPLSFRVTSYVEEDRYVSVFGQLIFTGSYVTGGDSLLNAAGQQAPEAFPPGLPANTGGLFVFLNGQTAVHATRPPLVYNIQLDIGAGSTAGALAVLKPGSGALNFLVKLYNSSTGAEFAASAYSGQAARLDNATGTTMELRFKKNV